MVIFCFFISQGTLIALASFSEGKLVDKLMSAALLSPVAYLSHITTPIGIVAARAFVDQVRYHNIPTIVTMVVWLSDGLLFLSNRWLIGLEWQSSIPKGNYNTRNILLIDIQTSGLTFLSFLQRLHQ